MFSRRSCVASYLTPLNNCGRISNLELGRHHVYGESGTYSIAADLRRSADLFDFWASTASSCATWSNSCFSITACGTYLP
jgi:hypothetical protein